MADEGNTARQTSSDGESGVHRLRDIVVEEVSLVDRAANKRRFLVVKRSEGMSGDSGESGVEKAKKKPEDEPTEEEKARRPADEGGEEDGADGAEKARRPVDEEPDEAEKAKA